MGFFGSCILRNLNVNLGDVHGFGSNGFSRCTRSFPALLQETVATGQPLLHCNNVQLKGSDRKCQYVKEQDSVGCATQAMEIYKMEKYIMAHIKRKFDKKYNPTGHCIIGRNFRSYVTHETKHFIYMYLGQVAIPLFKSG